MKIEEAFARYLEQDVLVYTVSQGGSLSSVIDCTLEEIGDGWVRVTQGDDRNESIVNTNNIIRIREYPRNKNGKKVRKVKTKTKKMIAPVVIVALISIYYIGIGVIFAYMNGVPTLAKIIALVVPALLTGVAVTVLIQRIKEIKKGEDDDLSKY